MRRVYVGALLLLGAGLTAACGGDRKVVGVVLPESGVNKGYGASLQAGIKLAFDDAVARQSPEGFEAQYRDSLSHPEYAAKECAELFKGGALIVIGGATSSEAKAMIPEAEKARRVLISPSASEPDLAASSNLFFRLVPSDEFEGLRAADFLVQQKKARTVMILFEEGLYADGMLPVFTAEVEKLGAKVAGKLPIGPTDWDKAIGDALTTSKPDAVFICAYGEEILGALTVVRGAKYPGTVCAVSAIATGDIVRRAGALAEGVLVPMVTIDLASTKEPIASFVKRFKAAHKGAMPDLFAAYGYDAATVALYALQGPPPKDTERAVGADHEPGRQAGRHRQARLRQGRQHRPQPEHARHQETARSRRSARRRQRPPRGRARASGRNARRLAPVLALGQRNPKRRRRQDRILTRRREATMKGISTGLIAAVVMALAVSAFAGDAADRPWRRRRASRTGSPAWSSAASARFAAGASPPSPGSRHDPLTYYFGGTGGGVWKTTDAGANWRARVRQGLHDRVGGRHRGLRVGPERRLRRHGRVADPRQPLPRRRRVEVHRRGPHLAERRPDDTRHIARVRIHPTNPDLVYVAAQGHAWGPNAGARHLPVAGRRQDVAEGALRGRRDGGGGPGDGPEQPAHPLRGVLAGRPAALGAASAAGPGSGLWKSTDGGDTLEEAERGAARGDARPDRRGRVAGPARAGCGRSSRRRSAAGSTSPTTSARRGSRSTTTTSIRERAWYYSWVYADPKNADAVWLPNVNLHRSIDGGRTFSVGARPARRQPRHLDRPGRPGPDHPRERRRRDRHVQRRPVVVHARTTSRRPSSTAWPPTTASRTGSTARSRTTRSVGIPSGVPGDGIDFTDWHPVGGGESGWIAPLPTDPEVVFAGEYGGDITRYDNRTRETREIMAWPQLADGRATRDLKYRFQWNAPILISPHDPKTLYHAAQVLLRSRDEGQTWEAISPDLTRNDPTKQGRSGGPISQRHHGGRGVRHDLRPGRVAAREGGDLGRDRRRPGAPHAGRRQDAGRTSRRRASPSGSRSTRSRCRRTTRRPPTSRPRATSSTTSGPTSTRPTTTARPGRRSTSGIPDGAFTRVIREDPVRRGLLFAGTETGLFVSLDGGASWRPFQRNLPVVPITDLAREERRPRRGHAGPLVLDPRRPHAAAPVGRPRWPRATCTSSRRARRRASWSRRRARRNARCRGASERTCPPA